MDIKVTEKKVYQSHLKSPIQKLDEYSLICILNKLPVADLVRVERVSKSWQQTAKRSWSSFKKLLLNSIHLGLKLVGTRRTKKKIMDKAVEQILMRCGRYLEEVDASNSRDDCYSSLIAEYCKNVQFINCFEFSTEAIKKIVQNCKNVSRLKIHNPSICKDKEEFKKLQELLRNLSSNNTNLRSSKLDSKYKISDDCLLKLQDQMNTDRKSVV